MDQTAAPWRALEDEAPGAGNGPSASPASAVADARVPRPTWFVAALAAAAVVWFVRLVSRSRAPQRSGRS